MKPLLNQKAFEQKQWRISISAFGAFTNGIMLQEQAFDSGPVNMALIFSILLIERLCSMELKRDKSVKVRLLSICL
jgi:hypothetical protein